jgi:hypothetical protein
LKNGFRSYYQNDPKVLITGVEWEFIFKKKAFTLKGNITWQNILDNEKHIVGTRDESNNIYDSNTNSVTKGLEYI